MKKLLQFSALALLVAALASCSKQQYRTYSGGQDHVSYVAVLTDGPKYKGISVVVDGKAYPYGKVYKVKAKQKAPAVTIEPGKHNVKIVLDDRVLAEEDIFIGLQQTKQFILK